jgi:hypothetical protein
MEVLAWEAKAREKVYNEEKEKVKELFTSHSNIGKRTFTLRATD